MHILDESHILLFLLQLLVLLGAARTLGALCEEIRVPAIAGEILAGVLLGPTVFGRISADAQRTLFPADAAQGTMLETVSWLGVFFLLLASGFHVDVRRALREGRAALLVGIVGVLVPIAIGYPVFATFDASLWGAEANRLSFSLFLAVAASITAISVVARAISDLGLAGSEDGTLALSACAVNDVFGWFLFTIVLSVATASRVDTAGLVWTSLGIVAFVAVCLSIGSRVVGFAARVVLRTSLPQPAALMTLIVTVGLLCGAVTQWLGIHAILGFFLAGTMVGSSEEVPAALAKSLSATLHAVFVPVFFATLALHIDFVTGMDLGVTAIFTAVAVGGKLFGAWLGARLARLPNGRSVLLGLVFIPGGAMEIVVGALALELELISETVFVAIVFAALASSIVAGPLVARRVRRQS